MVIIEIRANSDSQPRYERIDSTLIRIGRAPDNDVIIEDPYVDGHHLKIDISQPDDWQITDLETINGTHRGRNLIRHASLISGDSFRIGKTQIRIFDRHYQVAEALSLGDLEHRLLDFDSLPQVISLSLMMLAFGAARIFMGYSGGDIQPIAYITGMTSALTLPLGFAVGAALLSRLFRGEARFRPIFNLTLVFALTSIAIDHISKVAFYNIPGIGAKALVNLTSNIALGVVYLWLIMLLTTRLKLFNRNLIAGLFVVGLYGSYFISQYSNKDVFVGNPVYDNALYAPTWLFRTGNQASDYRARLMTVFDDADVLAEESSDDNDFDNDTEAVDDLSDTPTSHP